MTARYFSRLAVALAAVFAIVLTPALAAAQATIVIINNNAAGVGFNDPTPAAPVGGNTGTTLGQQRLNAFVYAASIWATHLDSTVAIQIRAQFTALTCTATSAVLGSAGATTVHRDFLGAPIPGTWYSQALANSLAGADLSAANPDINANFNVNLGTPGCLETSGWYLGLDANHGNLIDLPAVLLHELGHGMGFQTFTSGTTGSYLSGYPSVWDHLLYDNTQAMDWTQMTAAQRVASAINFRNLVWTGAEVTLKAPQVLSMTPRLAASAPASLAGNYSVGTAVFGPPLSLPGVTGEVMPVVSQAGGTGPGCEPFNLINQMAVAGKIALIDRGVCAFTVKVKNAQIAGAKGVVIANNVAGVAPGLGGSDPTITIPAVSISQADANLFKAFLIYRSRTRSGLFVTLGLDPTVLSGADRFGRLMMFTPNPFQSGSSVSHYDTLAFPNLLMEPNINGDLTHNVGPPWDLTLPLLKDIGWSINY
jgi:hypothetical protein